ncbi:uncharacterized protein LOC141908942 [Tubulanus polymorphus]|uniref:uncharacterized protein LOC141908942 n=1 Tax=Tubulanus polymorphus TaxID=672921 RepID=UPI003DA473C5
MKIAVEGCAHGELDKIYDTIAYLEKKENITVDLLLCCGDFQAVRNTADLQCMAVPPKYQLMNSFYKYYSGEKKAPILTVFIGGNHEASNYLQELPYGGWVAPNIYYLGYAGIIRFGGIRIGGLSGIFKPQDYVKGHFERPPYDNSSKRSAYHVRNIEVFRLKQIRTPIDILMSHDWPRGIYNYGNVNQLLRKKSFFREEVESNQLGSPAAAELLYKLKPTFWFSAHLHVKFPVVVEHKNDDESTQKTNFLALDKCLPNRDFLQVFDFPRDEKVNVKDLKLELDPEWLAVLKSTNHLFDVTRKSNYMPGPGSDERWMFTPTEEEISSIKEDFGDDFTIPENFAKTVPAYDPKNPHVKVASAAIHLNPQTELICAMLNLTNPNSVFLGKSNGYNLTDIVSNPGEISITEDDDDVPDDNDEEFASFIVTPTKLIINPAEISVHEGENNDDDNEDTETTDISTTESTGGDVSYSDASFEELNSSRESTNSFNSSLSLPKVKNDTFDDDSSKLEISFSAAEVNLSNSLLASSKEIGDDDHRDSVSEEKSEVRSRSNSGSEPPVKRVFKRRNMAVFNCSGDDSQ